MQCVYLSIYAKASGRHQVSCPVTLYLTPLRQETEPRLAASKLQSSYLFSQHHWGYRFMLGRVQRFTWVLELEHKAWCLHSEHPYPMSHLG